MIITYRPAGGTEQSWPFKPEDMLDVEATAIERVTGWTFAEFGEQLIRGSVLARKAILWVLRKRVEPALTFKMVTFRVGEFEWSLDEHEKAVARENIDSLDSDEDREALRLLLGDSDDDTGPKAA